MARRNQLAPPEPLYFAVRLNGGQAKNTDDYKLAGEIFDRLVKRHPKKKVTLMQVIGHTMRLHDPAK